MMAAHLHHYMFFTCYVFLLGDVVSVFGSCSSCVCCVQCDLSPLGTRFVLIWLLAKRKRLERERLLQTLRINVFPLLQALSSDLVLH